MEKFLQIALGVTMLLLIVASIFTYVIFFRAAVPASAANQVFVIERGMSISQIADSLQARRLIEDTGRLVLACQLLGWGSQLKAGRYEIAAATSNYDLLRSFRAGRTKRIRVTLPEGKTAEDFAEILTRELGVDKQVFLTLAEDSVLAQELGVPANRLEGYLFPNTYYLEWNSDPQEVIRILAQEFFKQIGEELATAIASDEMSLHEIVTLASIIEGEAMRADERETIAALYRNRLKANMLLQADPTIQYIVPGPPRRLLYRDLEIDSPYNTYRYAGLPPGPVNNPGIQSLRAAVNPASVGYLYMVARGDGSHVFSYNLNEHLRAKQDFDRVRAETRRQQRLQQRN